MATDKNHLWTPDDDAKLESAVTALASADLRDVKIWHAVAGRLAPELCVSPSSASSRYRRVVEDRRLKQALPAAGGKDDPWHEITVRIEELERDQGDRVEAAVEEILVRVKRLEGMWK